MEAVAIRELHWEKLQRHLLRSRVDGILYLGGPKKLAKAYLECFQAIATSTVNVCDAIELALRAQ